MAAPLSHHIPSGTIACAIDGAGSAASDYALACCVRSAQKDDVIQFVCVHCPETPGGMGRFAAEGGGSEADMLKYIGDIEKKNKKELQMAEVALGRCVTLAESRGLRAESSILIGDPKGTLLDFSRKCNPKIMFCGQRRYVEQNEKIILGSVTLTLVRGAHCPVYVAKEDFDSPKVGPLDPSVLEAWMNRKRKIICCVDETEPSKKVLDALIHMSPTAGDEVTFAIYIKVSKKAAKNKKRHEDAEQVLSKYSEAAAQVGLQVQTKILESRDKHSIHEIQEYVDSEKYSLLIVGSRGSGPVKRAIFGSVSVSLAEVANCDVLVAK